MVREEAIAKASRFLSDDNVKNSPDDKKRAYLLDKGLTTEEIEIAIIQCQSPTLPTFDAQRESALSIVRHYKYWLFLLLLGAGSVFYHYRRVVKVSFVLYFRCTTKRPRKGLCNVPKS
jgi:hypothetical protein